MASGTLSFQKGSTVGSIALLAQILCPPEFLLSPRSSRHRNCLRLHLSSDRRLLDQVGSRFGLTGCSSSVHHEWLLLETSRPNARIISSKILVQIVVCALARDGANRV